METQHTETPDILRGAEAIAQFLYDDGTRRRSVYNLVKTTQLPVFRLGATICARRSALITWITEQENKRKSRLIEKRVQALEAEPFAHAEAS